MEDGSPQGVYEDPVLLQRLREVTGNSAPALADEKVNAFAGEAIEALTESETRPIPVKMKGKGEAVGLVVDRIEQEIAKQGVQVVDVNVAEGMTLAGVYDEIAKLLGTDYNRRIAPNMAFFSMLKRLDRRVLIAIRNGQNIDPSKDGYYNLALGVRSDYVANGMRNGTAGKAMFVLSGEGYPDDYRHEQMSTPINVGVNIRVE